MFIELHSLHNYSPSCLNRDETNTPKDAHFGGYRRGRNSSQNRKRTMRTHPTFGQYAGKVGVRTRRLAVEIVNRLTDNNPTDADIKAMKSVFELTGLMGKAENNGNSGGRDDLAESDEKKNKNGKGGKPKKNGIESLLTNVIYYGSADAIDHAYSEVESRWAKIKKGDTNATSEAADKVMSHVLNSASCPDVALFGRMLATKNKTDMNVDASMQVAHMITTHEVEMDDDFFTAVDDLQPRGESGSSMMGNAALHGSTFYGYCNINTVALANNIREKMDLKGIVEGALRSAIMAIPQAKQNSTAAQCLPSFVMAVVRNDFLCSLANAFVHPVRPTENESLVQRSIRKLDDHFGRLNQMYGSDGIVKIAYCTTEDFGSKALPTLDVEMKANVKSVNDLVRAVLGAIGK